MYNCTHCIQSSKTHCSMYYQSSKVSLSDISTVHRIDIRSTLAKVGGARHQDISIAKWLEVTMTLVLQMLTRGETDYTGWGQVRARSGEGTFFPPCSIICLQERQVQIFWTTLPAIDITNHHQTKEVPCDCCEREIWCQLSSL